jgi:gluconokinase
VAACSALRRGYRERLREAISGPVDFVLLDASARRAAAPAQPALGPLHAGQPAHSQLATLELPHADEAIVTLDAGLPPES